MSIRSWHVVVVAGEQGGGQELGISLGREGKMCWACLLVQMGDKRSELGRQQVLHHNQCTHLRSACKLHNGYGHTCVCYCAACLSLPAGPSRAESGTGLLHFCVFGLEALLCPSAR